MLSNESMQMKRRIFLSLVGLLALAVVAPAYAQRSEPKIQIVDPWARLPAEGAKGTTAYFEAINLTNTRDTLLSASSPWADRVVFQHYVMQGYDMVAKQVPNIAIGARKKMKLRPGDFFLKLEGLTQPLKPDFKIPITLYFANAGRVEIEASVSNQLLGNAER